MKWFTSDWHLGHHNIIEYCDRPFKNVDEMSTNICGNMVTSLKAGDCLYILGDVGFDLGHVKRAVRFIKSVGIQIYMIWGNHDGQQVKKYMKEAAVWCGDMKTVKSKGWSAHLCHYPLRSWRKTLNLHGHCHGSMKPLRNQIDVGVDCYNFFPVSEETLGKGINDR